MVLTARTVNAHELQCLIMMQYNQPPHPPMRPMSCLGAPYKPTVFFTRDLVPEVSLTKEMIGIGLNNFSLLFHLWQQR